MIDRQRQGEGGEGVKGIAEEIETGSSKQFASTNEVPIFDPKSGQCRGPSAAGGPRGLAKGSKNAFD